MHAKHQNGPGYGYRSNAMGGVAAASRIPPEGAVRGRRMYGSEYRSYNRGAYGVGGHSKQFQTSLPPSMEASILLEAGKLAAEYLVSKGVLPPNALSGKWQNDGLKNQLSNFQGFAPHKGEKVQTPLEGRVSAHSRLGNANLDLGPGRRKHSDEYNSTDARSSIRGRKRSGSFKSYMSGANREFGRSGSWAEKNRASPGKEADSDASVGHYYEQSAAKDGNGDIKNLSAGEITQEVLAEAHIDSGLEKCNLVEDAEANSSSLSKEKYPPSAADSEASKKSDDADKSNDEAKISKEERNDNDLRQKHDENKGTTSLRENDSLVREDHTDLVKHSKFVNVPTKARSSLTSKAPKGDQAPMKEDVKISKREHLENSGVHVTDADVNSSAGSSHLNHEIKSRSNSMLLERGEKREIDFKIDDRGDFKKLRQWVPSLDAQSQSSRPLSSSMENQPLLQDASTSQCSQLTLSPDRKSLDISLFPRDHADSAAFMEEKQLFPGSFKTCDLNLVGTCDVSENHDADPMLLFPSVTQTGKISALIDVDLSISNNIDLSSKKGKCGVNDNDIEVIDLEKDSAQENKTFGNAERRLVFSRLDTCNCG